MHVVERDLGATATPNVEVTVPPGTLVRGDPVLLEQALVNLLENAVTHGGAGSQRARVGCPGCRATASCA